MTERREIPVFICKDENTALEAVRASKAERVCYVRLVPQHEFVRIPRSADRERIREYQINWYFVKESSKPGWDTSTRGVFPFEQIRKDPNWRIDELYLVNADRDYAADFVHRLDLEVERIEIL